MSRRPAVLALVVAGVLVLGATAALATVRISRAGEIYPNVEVSGVDVGGLSREDARERLDALADGRLSDPVNLTFEDQQFTVRPSDVSFAVDVDATIEAAFEAGRGAGFPTSLWRSFSAYWENRDVALVEAVDEEALDAAVGRIATELDGDPTPGALEISIDPLVVDVVPPGRGLRLDRQATATMIRTALSTDGEDVVELPVEVLPPRVPLADVEEVAEQVRTGLDDDIQLLGDNASVTLTPAQLAPVIGLREAGSEEERTVELNVAADGVERLLADDIAAFERPAVPADYDIGREPPTTLTDQGSVVWEPVPVDVGVIPSQPGQTFDPELTARQLEEMIVEDRNIASLRLKEIQAEFTTDDATANRPTELLGTFTTFHACCQTRVTNIQTLADLVDDTLVLPEEQFSVNQISGERTCTKGFRPAGMILNGEIVDVCGGGVSQFGTTTYNAAFFAGLPLDDFKAHSFYISRYPMGREATLNYPSPDIDVKFTNDTGHALLVRTSYTGTSITVSIYGRSEVAEVEAVLGSPFNGKPYPTRRRVNSALPPQSQRVVQSGSNGFTVRVTRIITMEDGEEITREFTTVYVPKVEIIEYNPESAPQPQPSPEPSPSDDGNGGAGDGSGDGGSGGDGSSGSDQPSPKPSPSPTDGGAGAPSEG